MDSSKKETKYISVIVMSIFITIFVVCYSMVGKATQNISDIESEKRENEEQMSSYQEQASDLLETKSALENLVSGLNSELSRIAERISDIESQIDAKTAQIENTKNELELAKGNEQKQYEDMKSRIKFMYEMGDRTYIDMILSSSSIAESLNKAEYFSELVKYDRRMLEKYKETKLLIEEKEQLYQTEQKELVELKEELARQQQLVLDKISSTNEQILLYADDIAEAEAAALEYEKRIVANQLAIDDESRRIEESSIIEAESIERESRERESRERERQESIEQSIRDAERSRQNETTSPQDDTDNSYGNNDETSHQGENSSGNDSDSQNNGNNTNSNYVVQPNDVDMMAALIECEAGDQSYYGMLCVGAVVVNRINSSRFPNTLYEVIYQPYQFTPVTVSGRFALVLARGADATCYQAAREVLEEGNIVGSWLYFRMNDGSRQGEVIGDHVFY